MSNFRRFPYEISREIFVLNYCITNSTLYLISKLFILYVYVSYIKIVLNFISILHIVLRESVWNFSFFLIFFFFISLVRHENRDEHCEFLILADIKILTRVLKLSHAVLIFKKNVIISALILTMNKAHLIFPNYFLRSSKCENFPISSETALI